MTDMEWVALAGSLALDVSIGATLLLLVVSFLVLLLHRAPAAARHVAWLCALGTLLVLPLAALAVPEWRWELPAPARTAAGPAAPAAAGESTPVATPAAAPSPRIRVTPVGARRKPAAAPSAAAPVRGGPPVGTLAAAALALWGVGVVAVLARCALRLLTLRRFAARCAPYPDETAVAWLAEAAARLGTAPDIDLLQAPADQLPTGPMTWGLQRPVVVLPPGALLWPPARMRSVLLHEVAHVRRRDWAGYLLAHVVCAVYWFHPLVWWAAARLRTESELACDDQVLRAGIPATEYAHALVEIIKTLRGPAGALKIAISMAQGPQIEQRLRAILDPRRRRGSLSPAGLAAAAVLSAAVAVPAAGVRVRPAAQTEALRPAETRTASEAATAPRSARVAWGQPVGGLRAGLEWASWDREIHPGEVLALRVRVRNAGPDPARLSCLKPSSWHARLDSTGRVTLTPVLQGGGAVQTTALWLAPGKECFVPGTGPRLRIEPNAASLTSAAADGLLSLPVGRYQVVAARPLMLQGASGGAGSLFTGLLPLQVLHASGAGIKSEPAAGEPGLSGASRLASDFWRRPEPVRSLAEVAHTPPAPASRPPAAAAAKSKAQQQVLRGRVLRLQQRIAETEEKIAELKARRESGPSTLLIRRLEERIAATEEELVVAQNQSGPNSAQAQDLSQLLTALEDRVAQEQKRQQARERDLAGERQKHQSVLLQLQFQLSEFQDRLGAAGEPTARPAPGPAAHPHTHPEARARPLPDTLRQEEPTVNARLEVLRQKIAAFEVRLRDARARGAQKTELNTLRREHYSVREQHEELSKKLLNIIKARLARAREGK